MTQTTINLTLEKRETLGKGVKHLRTHGTTPAVIHDHGKPSIVVQGDSVAMLKVYKLAGKHHPVELLAGGTPYTAMIKDAEFEPRKNQLNHVVFNAVSAGQKVEAEVPVEPKYAEGNDASPAERAGLMVLGTLDAVLVEALPNAMPDVIYYDAEKLIEVGDHVTIADLIVPKGVVIQAEPTQGIATVFEPSAVAAANDQAGGDSGPEAANVVAEQGSVDSTESAAAKATAE